MNPLERFRLSRSDGDWWKADSARPQLAPALRLVARMLHTTREEKNRNALRTDMPARIVDDRTHPSWPTHISEVSMPFQRTCRTRVTRKLGETKVEEGALADLLLVDGNPLDDIRLIADPENKFLVIMKDGVIYKDVVPK
jgi:hypothetical protein